MSSSLFFVPWCLLFIMQTIIVSVHTQECPYYGSPQFLVSDSSATLTTTCSVNDSQLMWTPPDQSVLSVYVYSSCVNISEVENFDEVMDSKMLEFGISFGLMDPASPELRMVDSVPVPTSVHQVCLYFGCYRRKELLGRPTFITFSTVSCTYGEDSTIRPTSAVLPAVATSATPSQTTPSLTPSLAAPLSTPPPMSSLLGERIVTSSSLVTSMSLSTTPVSSQISVAGTHSKSQGTTLTTTKTTIKERSMSSSSRVMYTPTPTVIGRINGSLQFVPVVVPVVALIFILVTVVMATVLCFFVKGVNKFGFSDQNLPLKKPFETEDKIYNTDPIDIHLCRKPFSQSEETLCDNLNISDKAKGEDEFVPSYQLDTHLGPSIEDLRQMCNKMLAVSDPNAYVDEAIVMESGDSSAPLSDAPVSGTNKMFNHWQYNFSRESGEYIDMDISSPLGRHSVEGCNDTWAGITTYAVELEGIPPMGDTNLICEDSGTVASDSKIESVNDGDVCCGSSAVSDSSCKDSASSSKDTSLLTRDKHDCLFMIPKETCL